MSIKPFYEDADIVLARYALGRGVMAFSTMRPGGVSKGSYASMNINPYCGDADDHIAENRRRLALRLGVEPDHIILPHQVHGTETRIVDAEWWNLPAELRAEQLEGADALTTNLAGVCVGVSTADCVPVLLYDPVCHVVAAVHAGWRGTLRRIVSHTLQTMAERYGTRAADLHAVIGPAISLHAFEVGDEVWQAFADAGFNMDEMARKEDKWHLNLPLCNRLQLEQLGVPAYQIADSNSCTYTQSDQYFSARRLGIHSGRIYSGIILQP